MAEVVPRQVERGVRKARHWCLFSQALVCCAPSSSAAGPLALPTKWELPLASLKLAEDPDPPKETKPVDLVTLRTQAVGARDSITKAKKDEKWRELNGKPSVGRSRSVLYNCTVLYCSTAPVGWTSSGRGWPSWRPNSCWPPLTTSCSWRTRTSLAESFLSFSPQISSGRG